MNEPKLKRIVIQLCEACLEGKGEECHTPGCALFLHNSPGHPIAPELYEETASPGVSETELREFQDEVRSLVIKLSGAPDSAIDGAGSDAGWQEFTLSEIGQGFAWLKDHQPVS